MLVEEYDVSFKDLEGGEEYKLILEMLVNVNYLFLVQISNSNSICKDIDYLCSLPDSLAFSSRQMMKDVCLVLFE